jgi:hypothetical protein
MLKDVLPLWFVIAYTIDGACDAKEAFVGVVCKGPGVGAIDDERICIPSFSVFVWHMKSTLSISASFLQFLGVMYNMHSDTTGCSRIHYRSID